MSLQYSWRNRRDIIIIIVDGNIFLLCAVEKLRRVEHAPYVERTQGDNFYSEDIRRENNRPSVLLAGLRSDYRDA